MRLTSRSVRAFVAALVGIAGTGVVASPAAAQVALVGSVRGFGTAAVLGSPAAGDQRVAMSATPSGEGYWVADAVGDVSAFGDALDHGELEVTPNLPIVAMDSTPSGGGYWMAASDGGVFTFGDAPFRGSLGAIALNQPIVGLATTPTGDGYWMVASDGGIFTFGDAAFHGSLGSIPLNAPIVNMAATPTGEGYWLVASDGGVFTFGDAAFHGSAGDVVLNEPIVDIGAADDGGGYWLAGGDGGIFTYGSADFLGAMDSPPLGRVVDLEVTPDGGGYWMLPSGLPLGNRCEGDGYEVSYPQGWSTNDRGPADPCSFFAPEPFTVPAGTEYLQAPVAIATSAADRTSYLDDVRAGAGTVLQETQASVNGAPATMIEWVSSGDGLLPDGTRSYGYVVELPDGRTLTLLTRSIASGPYDLAKPIVDEMAESMDLLLLDISTDADVHNGSTDTVAHLVGTRLGRAPGFDRLVLELDQPIDPSWEVRYVEGPATRPGSGDEVEVDGSGLLHITLAPVRTADLDQPGQPPTYTGPERLSDDDLGNITEAVLLGDFEAVLAVAIGVDHEAGFRVFQLDDPTRIIIDVNH